MSDQNPTDPRPAAPAPASRVPEKVSLDGLEDRWDAVWREQGTYAFDRTATREQVYSIDTPPPTVSGSLHVGHVFSYTHTDVQRPGDRRGWGVDRVHLFAGGRPVECVRALLAPDGVPPVLQPVQADLLRSPGRRSRRGGTGVGGVLVAHGRRLSQNRRRTGDARSAVDTRTAGNASNSGAVLRVRTLIR